MTPSFKRVIATPVLLSTLIFTGCASYSKNTNFEPGSDRVRDHLYAGIGIGQSWKDPDQNSTNFDVNDRLNGSGQLTVGMDLSRQVALELHTTDLGSAGFEGDAEIDYNVHGGSVLMYAGKNRHNFKRRGFTAYGRAGVGYLQNRGHNIPFRKVNDAHVLVGAGVEYMFSSGLGLRLEGISFEEDARYGQLGLVYRTGNRPQRRIIAQAEAAPAPAPVVAAAIEEPACTPYSGSLQSVIFHTDAATLTSEATQILDSVAADLADCPVSSISVSAHTDSIGSDEYNQALSERRAQSVSQYLQTRGLSSDVFDTTAFGESQPIDTNVTAEGRSRNRRVELFTD